jgi:transposase InsO family protein
VPAVQALLRGAAGSRRELLEALARQELPAVRPLVRRLVELRAMDALRYHELRSAGEPIPPELAGELIHLDIKNSGESSELDTASNRGTRVRGAGREFVHVAIDDASRLAYVEVLANEQATTTAALCRARALRHIRTRPYRPCTNGKAERFIQTMLREWAPLNPRALRGRE